MNHTLLSQNVLGLIGRECGPWMVTCICTLSCWDSSYKCVCGRVGEGEGERCGSRVGGGGQGISKAAGGFSGGESRRANCRHRELINI